MCQKNSMKSVYTSLTRCDVGKSCSRVWKARLLEKSNFFMWLVEQKAIVSKENMIKRNWVGGPRCYFCRLPKTCDHLLFECPIARVVWGVMATCFHQVTMPLNYDQFWAWVTNALPRGESFHMLGLAAISWTIWKARNMACFEKKLIKHPIEIIFSVCTFIQYWAGLYPEEAHRLIRDGVDLMMKTAIKLIGNKRTRQGLPAIQGG
jgi:hypothetical protein